jgi:hypothetical protein
MVKEAFKGKGQVQKGISKTINHGLIEQCQGRLKFKCLFLLEMGCKKQWSSLATRHHSKSSYSKNIWPVLLQHSAHDQFGGLFRI